MSAAYSLPFNIWQLLYILYLPKAKKSNLDMMRKLKYFSFSTSMCFFQFVCTGVIFVVFYLSCKFGSNNSRNLFDTWLWFSVNMADWFWRLTKGLLPLILLKFFQFKFNPYSHFKTSFKQLSNTFVNKKDTCPSICQKKSSISTKKTFQVHSCELNSKHIIYIYLKFHLW